MTSSEVAHILRISMTTLYRMVSARELPVYRVSGCLRFQRSDIHAYLATVRHNRAKPRRDARS